jgi:hypothetical protein
VYAQIQNSQLSSVLPTGTDKFDMSPVGKFGSRHIVVGHDMSHESHMLRRKFPEKVFAGTDARNISHVMNTFLRIPTNGKDCRWRQTLRAVQFTDASCAKRAQLVNPYPANVENLASS